jgi:hypothetical protein
MQTDTNKSYHIFRNETRAMLRQIKSNDKTYTKGFIFCFYFNNTEGLNSKLDCETISRIFETKFGFGKEIVEIDAQVDERLLILRILNAMYNQVTEEASTLFVFYYSGHGHIAHKNLLFSPTPTNTCEAKFQFQIIEQATLIHYRGPVLCILDCCYAGQAARGNRTESAEILAACGPNDNALGEQGHFTSHLCDLLVDIPVTGIRVTQLHSLLCARSKSKLYIWLLMHSDTITFLLSKRKSCEFSINTNNGTTTTSCFSSKKEDIM